MPESDYYAYQEYSTPTPQPMARRPSSPKYTYYLIGICIAVFILQSVYPLITEYFVLSPAFILERPWGIFTSMFLHADFLHILYNMIGLFIFGSVLEQQIGSKNFLYLFLLCGLVGSLGYLALADTALIGALGASGAIFGVIGAVTLILPNMKIYVQGFIPLPMYAAGPLYVLIEIFYLRTGGGGGIAHSAHVAGFFAGLALAYYYKKNSPVLKLNQVAFALAAVILLTIAVGYAKFPNTSGAKIISTCISSSDSDLQLQGCVMRAYNSADPQTQSQIDEELTNLLRKTG
ncbi:Rhomboid protease GlpG [Candidatus Gugararchaeum adminiculabundum]|nr:Rhomboid protease GlpG [Candidatus Gugararchaeum adminiculabundum]